jgi:hypothetical protein
MGMVEKDGPLVIFELLSAEKRGAEYSDKKGEQ